MAIAITNPNSSKAYVFAEKAEDLTVTGLSTSSNVTIAVYLGGSSVASFELTPHPVSASVVVRFREILNAILPRISNTVPSTTASYTNPVYVRATQSGTSVDTSTMFCFRGGIDTLETSFSHTTHWMTWKPQVTRTYQWGKEVLSFIKPKSTSRTIYAKIYFADGTSSTVTLGTFSSSSTQVSICSVNCSYSRIKGFSSAANKTVLAYDVYGGDIMAHRFIVKPTRLSQREFLFMNSLGVLDTAFATGDVSRDTESEIATARISGQEVELTNDAVEHFKVNTGGLRKRRDMDQWQDFFRSSDRWVLLQGDDQRRIVIDSIESDMTEHKLSGTSFTYHYADRFSGRHYSDTALPAFDYSNYEND